MPIMLGILASTLISAVPVTTLANGVTINQKQNQISNNQGLDNSLANLEIANDEEASLSRKLSSSIDALITNFSQKEDTIRLLIETSIVYNNKKELTFDLTKLEGLQGTDFFKLISANEFLMSRILTKLLEVGLLEYIPLTHNFNFKDYNNEIMPFNSHVWAKWKWTWFAYWELYFDHYISDLIAWFGEIGSGLSDFIDIIGGFSGPWAVGAAVVAAACAALSFYFSYYDHGNGVCIRWDAVIPRNVISR